MKYRAVTSFCGVPVSARMGEVLEISDENVAADLVKAGHIVPVEEVAQEAAAEPEKEAAKPVKKSARGKKNEAERTDG